jgi:hypothetical protein
MENEMINRSSSARRPVILAIAPRAIGRATAQI